MKCKAPGCETEQKATGLCHKHYQKAYRMRKDLNRTKKADPRLLEIVATYKTPKLCVICGLEQHAKGLCKIHYNRGAIAAKVTLNDNQMLQQLYAFHHELTTTGRNVEAKAVRQFLNRVLNV